MKPRFKLITHDLAGTNPLMNHLVEVARAWCDGRNSVSLHSLEDFHLALDRERDHFCRDKANKGVNRNDVVIISREENGLADIQITPIDFFDFAEATITLLPEAECEQKEVAGQLTNTSAMKLKKLLPGPWTLILLIGGLVLLLLINLIFQCF